MSKEKADVTVAPHGRFRVVEIDISAATGFYNDDPNGEHCATVIGDFRFLWRAKQIARRRSGGRFPRQVHDDRGTCIAYYH